jgi:hypothetical protein
VSRRTGAIHTALLVGCGDSTQTARIDAAEKEVAELKAKLTKLEATQQRQSFSLLELQFASPGVAYLQPGSTGYQPLQMELGRLTVAVRDVQPYANGSKVVLQFGNPLSATVDGIAFQIEWGQVDKAGMPNNDTAKKKEFSATETFLPGTWTATTVILDGVPPTELGFVRLSELKHRSIRLRGG